MLWNMCSFGWVSFLWRFKLVGDELFSHLLVSLSMRLMLIHNSIHWKKGLVMPRKNSTLLLIHWKKTFTSLTEDL